MNWAAVLAAFGCLFMLGLLDNTRGPLFPAVLAGLELTDTEGGVLFAVTSGAGGAGSLAGRWLVERLAPRRALHLGLLVAGAGMGLLGDGRSFAWVVVGSMTFGLAMGTLSLVQGTLVERGAPPELHRRVFGGLHSMYGLASLLAPLVVLAAGRAGLDWRATFRLLAIVPLVLLGLTLLLRDPPARLRTSATPDGAPRDPREVLVALMAGFYVASELVLSTRLVLHLRRLEWTEEAAAHALVGFFACLLTGRVLLGVVAVPWSNRVVLLGSAGLTLLLLVLGLTAQPLFLCAAGLTFAPFFPTAQALVAEEFPGGFERVMSLVLLSACVCVMTVHGVTGALSERLGLARALWISPVCLSVALALALASTAPRRALAPARAL